MRSIWLLLPVLFPAAGAVLSLCMGKRFADPHKRAVWVGTVLFAEVLLAAGAFFFAPSGAQAVYTITDSLQLRLKADNISVLFGLLSALMWLIAGLFSFEYMEKAEHAQGYYRFYLLTETALLALDLAGNYLTMYMAFEFMTVLSFPMVLQERTRESIIAAQKYLYYSIFGASLGLAGFFILGAYLPATEFAAGGVLAGAAGEHRTALLIAAMLAVIGFGTKAGMFPMHAWLPAAHPVAPAPASAVLSGVITKCGVLAVIRVVFYLLGADFIRGTWVQYTFMALALITVFIGSMLAYVEKGLKKRLAYSSVSQVSYVLFGLSTLHPLGFAGALLHVVFHSVLKDLLFLCAGSIIHQTGLTRVPQLRGIGKKMPVTMGCFLVGALGLTGIPPLCGFFSKWYLALGSLHSGAPFLALAGPVVLLLSAFLTALYLTVLCVQAFLPGRDYVGREEASCDPGWRMQAPMLLLAAAAVLFGVFVSPLSQFVSGIAGTLM